MLLLIPPLTHIKSFYNWVGERLKLGPVLDRFTSPRGHIAITLSTGLDEPRVMVLLQGQTVPCVLPPALI